MLVSLFQQKKEQSSIFFGRFCFSLGQLICLSIPGSASAVGAGAQCIYLVWTRSQITLLCSFASEGICYFGLSVQLELQTGDSGVCVLEVNEIMCFEQIKHLISLLQFFFFCFVIRIKFTRQFFWQMSIMFTKMENEFQSIIVCHDWWNDNITYLTELLWRFPFAQQTHVLEACSWPKNKASIAWPRWEWFWRPCYLEGEIYSNMGFIKSSELIFTVQICEPTLGDTGYEILLVRMSSVLLLNRSVSGGCWSVLCCYNLSLMKILKVLEKFGLNVIDESISRTQWFKDNCCPVLWLCRITFLKDAWDIEKEIRCSSDPLVH